MIAEALERVGLSLLGGFRPAAGEHAALQLPADVATLVLLGWPASDHWRIFTSSPEYADRTPNPLDRWTRRVVDALATDVGATPLYPFGGPPWQPFQAWAQRAGIARPSPIGLLIHPRYGLWHSYRAALAFARPVVLSPSEPADHPCDSCRDKPCLSACPVEAYGQTSFAVADCRTYVTAHPADCLAVGCHSRDACPVGRGYRYGPEQIAFHQRAFAGLGR
ncbi:MAG: ferredoxin [Ancalomicrobiaceae bacterium]|nr:ferredoxin [Ancalomicrobiaceae bacterium]